MTTGGTCQAKECRQKNGARSQARNHGCNVKLAPTRPSPLESRPVTGPLKPESQADGEHAVQGSAGLCRALQSLQRSREEQAAAVFLLSLPHSLFVLSRPSRVGELSNQAKGNLRGAVEGNSGIKVLEDAELTSGLWRHLFVCWWLKGRAGFWCEEGEGKAIRILDSKRILPSLACITCSPPSHPFHDPLRSAELFLSICIHHPSSLNHLQRRSRTGSQVFICIMARPRAGLFPEECSSCERSTPSPLHIHSSSISLHERQLARNKCLQKSLHVSLHGSIIKDDPI